MRKYLKRITLASFSLISPVFYLWSFIYSLNIKQILQRLHEILYSMWIRRFLGYMGNVHFVSYVYLTNPQFISIDDGSCIGRRTMISAWGKSTKSSPIISIGKNCDIGDDCNLQSCCGIKIGDGVLTGRKVMINDTSHGTFKKEQLDIQPSLRPLMSKGSIIIEDNVWLGEMACILGGVTIGKGSIIGAGSVVTKSIPPYSLAVGSPAKVIKSFSYDS